MPEFNFNPIEKVKEKLTDERSAVSQFFKPAVFSETLEKFRQIPGIKQVSEFFQSLKPETEEDSLKQGLVNIGSKDKPVYFDITGAVGSLKNVAGKSAQQLTKEMVSQADTAVTKLINAIKTSARPAREELAKLQSLERVERAGAVAGVLEKAEGEKGFFQALGKLKGELVPEPKLPAFEGLRGPTPEKLVQSEVDELFKKVQQNPLLNPYEKITASTGLKNILEGTIPPPSQLSLLEDTFGSDLVSEVLKRRTGKEKFLDVITETANIPRSLITSFDMSAPLRQGVVFTLTRPKSAAKATREMFRQVFSQKNFSDWLTNLHTDPIYPLIKESKLYIADPSKLATGLSSKEEKFMTNFAQKVPIIGSLVKASERAYVSYLNKLRVDVFKNISNKFIKDGLDPKVDKEIFDSLAEFVNTATGRGDMGKSLNKVSQLMNSVFFSPRLIASRFNMLNPAWYIKQPPPVRKEAIKSMAEFIGVGSTILTLAKVGGADVELDPRSTDFGKIRVGDSRWDIWGGFQQWIRVISQMASGARKTTTKKEVIPLSAKKFPFETRLDVAERFLKGKLAPIPRLITELMEGQKLFGEEITLEEEALNNTIPLYVQDIQEALEGIGPDAIFTVGIPGFFGVGVQTYIEQQKKGKEFNF